MSAISSLLINIRSNLGEATQNFYFDTDLKGYIGEAYRYYVLWQIEEGDGYYELVENVGFTANNPNIDLSTALTGTFFSLVSVERNTAEGTIPLEASKRRFNPNSTLSTGQSNGYRPTYKLVGLNLVIEPTPQQTETGTNTTGLRVNFNGVPVFPDSTSLDSFVFNVQFSSMYDPLIELWTTIAALEAKDAMGGVSDIETFRGRLLKWEDRFKDSIAREEFPDHVTYVGNEYDNWNNWGW